MIFPDLPHLKQLQTELWRWPKSRASLMVGAGLSLNAAPLPGITRKFPTWRELAYAMFNELYPKIGTMSKEEEGQRNFRFLSLTPLQIASLYEATFNRQKLENLIRKLNPDLDYLPGRLHHLLLQLPWVDVFTTNYDTLLERTEISGRSYQLVTKAEDLTTSFSPRIIKLHGSFPSSTPYIISEEDYRTYPKKFAPFINSVQQSLLENSFVLLGFSGEDPNFIEWSGWIRDELGDAHAPIYLVGALSLGDAQRSLLSKRGVTPIDLTPIFKGSYKSGEIHAAAIEWFLKCLIIAKPARPERWPLFNSGVKFADEIIPLVHSDASIAPAELEISPDFTKAFTPELFQKAINRWLYERLNYPGWIVADDSKREYLWTKTKYWIKPLAEFSKHYSLADRLLLFREINWRLETSMTPLFSDWISIFEATLDEIYPKIVENSKDITVEIISAWIDIALGLLREARETYNVERWNKIKEKIGSIIGYCSQKNDKFQYEEALWEIWNVNRRAARNIINKWQPSQHAPLANMWKAGLLAELDELGEARNILRSVLSEIREALRNQGENIELLSMEGWCTFSLCAIEASLEPIRYYEIREEFWERWQELKALDCSPWPQLEYFEKALSASPPKPFRNEQIVHGYDPGETSTVAHWASDSIDPYLPAFSCIRFYEQAGIPMRLTRFNIGGDSLKRACQWIAPFIGFWSPALLIRSGSIDSIKKGNFLSRTSVSLMDQKLATRLYDWCLDIFEKELDGFTEFSNVESSKISIFEVLSEVLSRLSLKADSEQLRKTFPLVIDFHDKPGVMSHIRLHEVTEPWFKRLFLAADDEMLLDWMPTLIKFPLFREEVLAVFPPSQVWPDPMRHFPVDRIRKAAEENPKQLEEINKAADWLLKRAQCESGESRQRALYRLVDVFHAGLMSSAQQQLFGQLLWSQQSTRNLPNLPHFSVFSFLHLPAPAEINVKDSIKTYILNLDAKGCVTKDDNGKVSVIGSWSELPLLRESSSASKPLIRLFGKDSGRIEWTCDETKLLYLKIKTWWENDRKIFSFIGSDDSFRSLSTGPVVNSLRRFGEFLSRIVLPNMSWADENEWLYLIAWLDEMRALGVFINQALPYMLIHRPSEFDKIFSRIIDDLNGQCPEAVVTSAQAVRHWIHLALAGFVPEPPPDLLSTLINKVVFRSRCGIASCVSNLNRLIVEKPDSITIPQGKMLLACLGEWNFATKIIRFDEPTYDFSDDERIELRVLVARLAGALEAWHRSHCPRDQEFDNIALWRQTCALEALPEIRRAFSECR